MIDGILIVAFWVLVGAHVYYTQPRDEKPERFGPDWHEGPPGSGEERYQRALKKWRARHRWF